MWYIYPFFLVNDEILQCANFYVGYILICVCVCMCVSVSV